MASASATNVNYGIWLMKHIVSLSGGIGSAEALKRTVESYGAENTIAVFADVKGHGSSHFFSDFPIIDILLHERFGGESRDTYRFIWQLAAHFDLPVHRVGDDRSIWHQFAKSKAMRLFVGGSFFCPASETLKRIAIASWVKTLDLAPGDWNIVLGMGYDEEHRVRSAKHWWSKVMDYDVQVFAPNRLKPWPDTASINAWLMKAGIELPSAYPDGFEHNNCNGGCVQAGQAHFANLYRVRRLVYMYWAWMESRIQNVIGRQVTILKDQRGNETTPLSLYDFIPRIEIGDYRKLDYGACGCFTNSAMANFLAECEIVMG